MDTVHEENSSSSLENSPVLQPKDSSHFIQIPHINVINEAGINRPYDFNELVHHDSLPSSRRPSAILAALRRPSQAIALSAAQAVMTQRRHFLDLFHGHSEKSIPGIKDELDPKEERFRRINRELGDDALTTVLSALYAKLLVVLGMAFPITEVISKDVRPFFYQGFHLYLYLVSISFVMYMYATFIREKTVTSIINSYQKNSKTEHSGEKRVNNSHVKIYGSFYLRVGAIAFGIGSMVYSGLEFGRYFETKNNVNCYSTVLQAITPATRMLLTMVQVQFIFLNTKEVDMKRHNIISKFGLMHMIATNLCEWLYVLVEETKHEIIHLAEHNHHNLTNATTTTTDNTATTSSVHAAKYCQEGQVMGSLVTNASPFLFPCTIEYSLICAVILFEMWKKVRNVKAKTTEGDCNKMAGGGSGGGGGGSGNGSCPREDSRAATTTTVAQHYNFGPFGGHPVKPSHHFTVDCSNAHRGLFAGIMVIVLTIISLIMFFVLANEPDGKGEGGKDKHKSMAGFEVNIVELVLYVITTVAVIVAMVQMRSLKYDRKISRADGQKGIGMDNTLLVVAQTGMFIYCMFSIIGCYFTTNDGGGQMALVAEIFSFIQTCLQTIFILDGWWRRCRNLDQVKRKPGKEIITFLLIANMAMWIIYTLEKNRAEFRPRHLKFFGNWAWTVITHISMPLAIFYRFHSTICLFEIWKTAYKLKTNFKPHLLFPVFSMER